MLSQRQVVISRELMHPQPPMNGHIFRHVPMKVRLDIVFVLLTGTLAEAFPLSHTETPWWWAVAKSPFRSFCRLSAKAKTTLYDVSFQPA